MLYHEVSQSMVMHVPDPFALRELLPKSRVLGHTDYNLQVKHTHDAVRVLRNIGVDTPAPILTQYTWPGKYKPFAHQRAMADFLTMNRRAFNLSEMGVGKSAAALWSADWLMARKLVRKTLVLTPLSTTERVWKVDIFNVLMHRNLSVVYGSREQRLDALNIDADFYILNHDGVSTDVVANTIRKRPDIGLVIVDEAHLFRNPSTNKYKSLAKMLRPDQWLWVLTGTPCPNAPTDAWALARLVNPTRVPGFFGTFRRQTMVQISQFKWVPRPDAYDIAFQAMQPAIRFKKADCLDLPPVTTQERQAPLSVEQTQMFKDMHLVMQTEASTTTITAVNAADKITKLRQILCGAIKDPDTDAYIMLPHKGRTEVLLDAIRGASAKVLVIVPFKGITQSLEKEIAQHYSVAVLNGDVSPKQRNAAIHNFKTSADPHVLLCHPQVMAHGLNLTEADMLVFYAPIYSNDQATQVAERFNRSGQTRKMTIVRIGAHPLEWEIYKMVDNRTATQENILKLYKSVTE